MITPHSIVECTSPFQVVIEERVDELKPPGALGRRWLRAVITLFGTELFYEEAAVPDLMDSEFEQMTINRLVDGAQFGFGVHLQKIISEKP